MLFRSLGASVNLIPFSVYQKLGLGELKHTSITLQLADHSVREPRGIVEDVLVKIKQFYYPVDFYCSRLPTYFTSQCSYPYFFG